MVERVNLKMISFGNPDTVTLTVAGYSTKGKSHIGGWSATLVHGQRQRIQYGFMPGVSGYRAELFALVTGLNSLKKRCSVTVRTATEYVYDSIYRLVDRHKKSDLWFCDVIRGKAKNSDLWIELLELSKIHKIITEWIPFRSKDLLTQDAFRNASKAARSRRSQDFRPATNRHRNYVSSR